MKYGIFSDIHSNIEALEKVLDALQEEGVDGYVCGGDIVGYGANPRECIDKVRELNPIIVCGNHDWAVGGTIDTEYFNDYAKVAIEWTRKVLNDEYKEYLNGLRLVYKDEDITLVHATLDSPDKFEYMQSIPIARRSLNILETIVCFMGHTHVPVIFTNEEGDVQYLFDTDMEFIAGSKQIVNIGSVGQPRDGDTRACYAIYDTIHKRVQIKRVAYDFHITQKKILEAGLPEFLALRLGEGK
ncbi:MAG: metallophosphoesterase family protein [Candidatus Omnitrophica bacterium]|nr:metallophosphoesterase family protein [Candidatus Omnitrophota bacterium]